MRRTLAIWLLAAFAWPAVASAHSVLVNVEPADGSVLPAAPSHVVLRFNEPIALTAVRLVDAKGVTRDDAPAQAHDDTIDVTMPATLPRGTQVLSYRIVSADSHPVSGSVLFSIGMPSGTSAPAENAGPLDGAIWLTRLGLYLGLFGGIGGVLFLSWLDPVRPARRAVAGALAVGAVSAVLALGLQGLDLLGLGWGGLFSAAPWRAAMQTSLAPSLGVAVLGFALAGVALRANRVTLVRALSTAALLCVGATLALSGHAATAPPQALTRATIFVHGLCVSFWVGALWPLFVMARRRAPQLKATLARFSDVAIPLVAVLVLSGSTLAVVQLETPSALLHTPYGRLLLAKITSVVLLLGLAALNRWRLTATAGAGLRRSIAAEGLLAVTILGLVAGWRFTVPPRALAAESHLAMLQMQGADAMADGTATPARTGRNVIEFDLMSGAMTALVPREVSVTLSLPSAGIEPIARPATLTDAGLWRVDALLPQPGRWHLRAALLIDDFHEQVVEGDVDIAP